MIILKVNCMLFNGFARYKNFKRYSLTERFQLSENIKVCKAVLRSLVWICTANTIACSCMIADNFHLPIFYGNLSGLIIDISFFWYVFTIPLKMFFVGEQWRTEFFSVIRMLRPRINPSILKGFNRRVASAEEETNRYFDMLTSQWEGGANSRKNVNKY
ncbi:hypothetical protein WR25_11140 [Diploscapter pachys]|uniref:7TM GPCR serpentine receptor class x (Srx) domain-containing protein n=1 Tax=Diploscapter pachys TaxID=2018661 RepID=A0A2A2JIZ2_9BILA|nr:hypothetical protein WR25_11140 [Diploscapter pachys]